MRADLAKHGSAVARLSARTFGSPGYAAVILVVGLVRGMLVPPWWCGLASMPSRLATVDVEDLPGDEGRLLQVEDPVGDVADLARAA